MQAVELHLPFHPRYWQFPVNVSSEQHDGQGLTKSNILGPLKLTVSEKSFSKAMAQEKKHILKRRGAH